MMNFAWYEVELFERSVSSRAASVAPLAYHIRSEYWTKR